MKKISKKLLAALLALAMVISAAPLTGVFAIEDSEQEQIVIDPSTETDFSELGENLDILQNISDSEDLQNIDMSGIKEALNLESEDSEEAEAEAEKEETSEAPEIFFGPEAPAEEPNFLTEKIEKPLETMAVVEMLSTNSTIDYTISVNETLEIECSSGNVTYIKFVPETDGFYAFQSIGSDDTVGYIYDENYYNLRYNDDYIDGNFYVAEFLEAGKTYYFGARFYSYYSSEMTVSLTKIESIMLNADEMTNVVFEGRTTPYLEILPQVSGIYTVTLNNVTYDDDVGCNYFGIQSVINYDYTDDGYVVNLLLTEGKPCYLQFYAYGPIQNVEISLSYQEFPVLELDKTMTFEVDDNNNRMLFIKFTTAADGFYIFKNHKSYFSDFSVCDSNFDNIDYSHYSSSNECKVFLSGNRTYYIRFYSYVDSFNMSVTMDKNVKMYNISENSRINIDVSSNTSAVVKFVPKVTGDFEFKSISNADPMCGLYVEHGYYGIKTDDDSGNNNNFILQYHCEAGKSYYFIVELVDSSSYANFDVKLTEICNHTVTNNSGYCDKCGESVFVYDTVSDYDENGNWIEYIAITDCKTSLSGTVYIPEIIDGYTVEGIEPDVFDFDYNVGNITGIYISKNIKYFEGFYNPSIAEITVDSSNEHFTAVGNVVYSKNMETLAYYPAAKEGTSFTVPDCVKKIGNNAFYDCSNLETIKLSSGLNTIGDYAFKDCNNLTDITIPSTVTEIGESAFANCGKITSINIPEGVETINYRTFYNCSNLAEVTIPSTVKVIDAHAFAYCETLESITIPESVETISSNAFGYCYNLSDITIVGDKTIFTYDCFYNTAHYIDSSNWDISEFGDRFYYIDGYLVYFDNNSWSNYDIEIKEGTRFIAPYVFHDTYFNKVHLPDTVKYIGDEAFYYSQITEINLPDGVELGERVFAQCYDLETITAEGTIIGLDSEDLRNTAFYDNKDNYENGILYLGDVLLKVLPEEASGEFVVSEKFTQIGNSAFENCASITSITIPETVNYIGDGAFTFCASLESINLPEGLEVINPNTFAGCLSLKSIQIPSTVKEIGEFAFALNIALESFELPEAITEINQGTFLCCVNFKELPLNDNIIAIDEFAFCGCTSVEEITIGANIEEIGYTAFTGCTSLKNFIVDLANAIYETDSYGALYMREELDGISRTALISYPSASPATKYVVPEDCIVFFVPFVSCVNLESIVVHDELFINPLDGDYFVDEALIFSAISAATMKVDINSLIDYIKDNGEDIESLAHDIYDIIYGFDAGDDENLVFGINTLVEVAEKYITRFNSLDQLCNDLLGLLTEVFEVASFDTFKGFDYNNHPFISDDNGVLYITDAPEETDYSQKILVSCPAATTGKVNIASGTTNILYGAFAFCDLEKVTIPDSIEELLPITFSLSRIDELTIPENVHGIDEAAFLLSEIKTLKLKNRICFENANYSELSFIGLFADKIVLPSSLEYVPEFVFAGCLAKEYDLPSSIKYIEELAFVANIFLEEISIPAKTTYIGEGAFIGCVNLKKVSFNKLLCNLRTIGDGAFALTSITEFNLPNTVQEIGLLAVGASASGVVRYLPQYLKSLLDEVNESLGDVDYSINTGKIIGLVNYVANWFEPTQGIKTTLTNKYFKAVDGDLFNAGKTNLIKVAEAKSGNYNIPNGVMKISGGAFAFTKIQNVYIPDSVSVLDDGAFAYSEIADIAIGGGVTHIPNSAFSGCFNLKRVVILPTVTSIDEDAFYGCSKDLVIVGYPYSYAHEYAIENEIRFETIDGRGYVSLKAPTEVASAEVPVYGNTLANTSVEIYVNGTKVGNTDSGSNGYWRSTIEIPDPVNNTAYEITARIYSGTENEVVSAPIIVNYSTTTPAFLSITAYHSNQSRTISLYDFGKTPEYMSFSSYSPFTYEIKLSAYDGTKTLYVVSGNYKIPAVYDEKTDTYIATGFFESSRSYVPEYVTLELDGCVLANTSFRFPFIIDPSGFIYEAVHSNRVEGANVSIYYQDDNGLAQLWNDAFIYGQESSIITGTEGLFSWNVPNGYWQVKAEKENYETAYSEWLPVPPEQLEVYIGLITKLTPNVKYINGYTDGIEVTFDQYMDTTTINNGNLTVTDESGVAIGGSWTPVDAEVSGANPNVIYATTFRFIPYSTLEGNYTVTISDVENYADKALSVPYINTVNIKPRVETLSIPENLFLTYGNDYTEDSGNEIVIDGGEGAAGLTVNVILKNNFYISSVTSVTLDEEGKATVKIEPTKPGVTTVSFNLDGTNLVEETEVTVKMPEEIRVTGVSISETSAELQVNAEKQFFAYVAPDFATDTSVVWSSSDENIATVDQSGIVKGINPGSAKITVTTVEGGFSAESDITIVPVSYVITWIINGEEQYSTLFAGDAITAPQVPEIEGYEFKGWSAEIPATMPEENLTFTAIYDKSIIATGITLSDSNASIYVGEEKQLTASLTPAGASSKALTWTSADTSVATVDENGLVKAVKAGKTTITVATADGALTAKCELTVKATEYTVTWIVEGSQQSQTVKISEKIVAPESPELEGFKFIGWTPEVPEVMPEYDLTFTAVFEKIPDEPVVPSGPVKEDIIIDPTVTTIKYGDAILLNVPSAKIPEGGYVEWKVDNDTYFKYSKDSDTSLRLDPEKSGTVTVTATIYDAEGNAVSTDSQTMTSKAGFFDKIIAFFKKIFGLTKVYLQTFGALY